MLESPLVPDGSAPGTQLPMRSERPLTRREIREREAAEALRLEGLQARVESSVVDWPQVDRAQVEPARVEPAQVERPQNWSPQLQHQSSPQVQHSSVQHSSVRHPGVEHPQVAAPDPFASAQPRALRPGFDDLFGSGRATAHPTPQPTPQVLSNPTPAPAPTPRRRPTPESPVLPEAEQTDPPVGRSSASAVSRRSGAPAGFDALFAGLEADDPGQGDDDPRPARPARPSRAERKAAKAAKSTTTANDTKRAKVAKSAKSAPSGPRRTGVPTAPAPAPAPAAGDFAALIGGTAASVPTASAAAQASGAAAGFAAVLSAAAGVPTQTAPGASAPLPTPAPLTFDAPVRHQPAVDPFEFSVDAAAEPFGSSTDVAPDLFGFAAQPDPAPVAVGRRAGAGATPTAGQATVVTTPTHTAGAAASIAPALPTPSRDERRLQQSARDVARSSGPRTAKVRVRSVRPSRPATSATSVRSRGRRFGASVVAMSFAALLAVATTIPSLSLLSAADVQALALSNSNGPGLGGQRVELNGDIVAQSVQREGYESQTIEEYARAAGIRPEATFTNNPLGTIQWPFAVGVHIGDRFGYRDCYGCSSDHHGQDFNPGFGAQIQAIADGVVSGSTDEGGSLGVVTMIDHNINGQVITSVYAHMEYGSRRFEVGDTVHVADIVGLVGDTGMSTGPHLHFEIRIGGIDGYWVDPLEWLYANTN